MDRPDRYELLALNVTPESRKQYDRGLRSFLQYLEETERSEFSDLRLLDGYLTDFAVYSYKKNNKHGRQAVINAMLGVELYYPEIRGKLIMIRASIQGWAKQVPKTPRKVIGEELTYGIAVEFLRRSKPAMATAILTTFECYLRSGDLQKMRCQDFIFLDPPEGPDGKCYGSLSIPKTKRGSGQSVYIRSKLIAELLRRQKSIASKQGRELANPMFTFHMASIRKEMKHCLARFQVDLGGTALHGFRYGGATTDEMKGRLTADDIKKRGRWASDKSRNAYIQPAEVHAQLQELSPSNRELIMRRFARRYAIFNVEPAPV